jgi:hypothetical protein
MFTTAAVVSTIGIAKWLNWRTGEIRASKLAAFLFLAAILIAAGVTGDRMEIARAATSDVRDVKAPAAPQHTCYRGAGVNTAPNPLSLSRMRYFGAPSHGNASVIWRASQSAVGLRVTANHPLREQFGGR